MPEALPVYQREINNRMYKPSAYFWGSILANISSLLIYPILVASITFYFLGFNDSSVEALLAWNGVILLSSFAGVCFGQALGVVVTDLT